MNHLHVRCPSCAKLYQVNVGQIFSTSPHFACVECQTQFTFDFPPTDPQNILTRKVQNAAQQVPKIKKCVKCGFESPYNSVECLNCRILFEKLDSVVNEKGVRTQPSLVRRWKELLQDYNNIEAHHDFIYRCQELDAAEFARQKYSQIKRLQGTDEVADQMLAKIEALRAVKVQSHLERNSAVAEDPELQLWQKVLLASPFFVSLLLVLLGVSHAPWRNMISAGVVIGILSYSLIVAVRGRFSLKDFLP